MRLTPAALRAWLCSDAAVDERGAVWSWHNPEHPGYRYPEAAGLLLGALADEPDTLPLRARVAAALARDVDARGLVGRGGAGYAFDTCVCLAGLLAHERAGGVLADPGLPDRMARAACALLDRGVAHDGPVDAPAGHWSVSYGSHLLKCAVALTALDERSGDARCAPTVRSLVEALEGLGRRGRFPVHGASEVSYLHATLYALEGLLCLRARAWPGLDETLEAGVAWVAGAQDEGGGLRAWHDGQRAWGPRRSDATAQAMRLWAGHDRARWDGPIGRARAFLAGAQGASGGVSYEDGSRDENTWATAFTLQALRWEAQAGDARWVL